MKTFKFLLIFCVLINLNIYSMQKNKNKTLNFDLNQIEYFTSKPFSELIQNQKKIGKPYILVEVELEDKKKYFYDAHEFNKYHFGYPITKNDLTDRQNEKLIVKIKYFICHKQKEGFKEFKSFDESSCDEYYLNCNEPKLYYTLASQENYGMGPGSSRAQYYLLSAQQNNDYDIKSKALVKVIRFQLANNETINKILQTTNIDLLNNQAKIFVNYFFIVTDYDKQDPPKKLARLKFCYDQEEFPNTRRDVAKEFANLLYKALDNSPKNIQLKINYLTEISDSTYDKEDKINYELWIGILYYLLSDSSKSSFWLKEAYRYLNSIFSTQNIPSLYKICNDNNHDLHKAMFYYAKMHYEGSVVKKDIKKANEYFSYIYDYSLNTTIKTEAAMYLGKINNSLNHFRFIYENSTNMQAKAIACAYLGKLNAGVWDTEYLEEALTYENLPEDLKKEVEELLIKYNETEQRLEEINSQAYRYLQLYRESQNEINANNIDDEPEQLPDNMQEELIVHEDKPKSKWPCDGSCIIQ